MDRFRVRWQNISRTFVTSRKMFRAASLPVGASVSANPEAFNFLRQQAYDFVRRNGKERSALHSHCSRSLSTWRQSAGAGFDLSDAESRQIVRAVTDWTIKHYVPGRARPVRDREERAATVIAAPLALEFAEEIHGKASVRNAARISGQSKSTIARHLKIQGVSPKRIQKIEKLPLPVQNLLRLLEENFPRDGRGIVSLDALCFALWEGIVGDVTPRLRDIPKATRSKRRKALQSYLDRIAGERLGFHFWISDDVIVVWQGRKFPDMKTLGGWLLEEQEKRGFRRLRLPSDRPPSVELFWSDAWLQDVLLTVELGLFPNFDDPLKVEPLLRLMRLSGDMLLDVSPVLRAASQAIRMSFGFGHPWEHMFTVAARMGADQRDVARHVNRVGAALQDLYRDGWGRASPGAMLFTIERCVRFMQEMSERHPESYARIRYVENVILADVEDCYELPDLWRSYQTAEKEGRWHAPPDPELFTWKQIDDIPF